MSILFVKVIMEDEKPIGHSCFTYYLFRVYSLGAKNLTTMLLLDFASPEVVVTEHNGQSNELLSVLMHNLLKKSLVEVVLAITSATYSVFRA